MMKPGIQMIAVIAIAGTIAGCSREMMVDNTAEAAVGATKLVVKGAVGAGKLAVKGGKKAVRTVKASTAGGFPPGTRVCRAEDDTFYAAPQAEDGLYYCIATTAE